MWPHGTTSSEQLSVSHRQNVWNEWHQPNGGALGRGALCEVCACVCLSVHVRQRVRACVDEVYPSRQDVVCVDFAEWMVIVNSQKKKEGGVSPCVRVNVESVCVYVCVYARVHVCHNSPKWVSKSSLSVQVCPHVTAVRSRSRREDNRLLVPQVLCNCFFFLHANMLIQKIDQTQLGDKLKNKALSDTDPTRLWKATVEIFQEIFSHLVFRRRRWRALTSKHSRRSAGLRSGDREGRSIWFTSLPDLSNHLVTFSMSNEDGKIWFFFFI